MTVRIASVLVALIAVGGCGGGSEPAEPTPPPEYTLEQLVAALPEPADVDGATGDTEFSCPNEDDTAGCEPDMAAVLIPLESTKEGAERERDAATFSVVPETLYVRAYRFDTANEAADAVAEEERETARFIGDFDIAAEDNDDGGWVAGQRGSGVSREETLKDWTGRRTTAEVEFTDPEDAAISPTVARVDYDLVLGTTWVSVTATVPLDSGGLERAETVALEAVERYIERLG